MNYMIIDIGSNSVKYDAFKITDGSFETVDHFTRVMGFLSYLDDGVLSKKGFLVLCDILESFKEKALILGCEKIAAFATASFRSCKNPQELISAIETATGIKVVLFSGTTEGKMSFLGMLHKHPEVQNGIMLDMGGGSTEINLFENRESIFLKSLPVGALNMKNKYAYRSNSLQDVTAFATKDELYRIYDHAYNLASSYNIPQNRFKDGILVGGSAKIIGGLCAKPDSQGFVHFTKQRLGDIIEEYLEITPSKAEFLIKTVPERYLLIIPAAMAYKGILDYMGVDDLTISKGGIREGYMSYVIKNGVME